MFSVPREVRIPNASAQARIRRPHRGGIMETDTRAKHPQTIQIQQHTFMGMVWCAAWLFTIGYLHLSFWRGILAIFLWPYYIGAHLSAITH